MMVPPLFTILHSSPGMEIALLEYLYRVFLHLLAFGGIAALVFWGLGSVKAIHSSFVARRVDEANER